MVGFEVKILRAVMGEDDVLGGLLYANWVDIIAPFLMACGEPFLQIQRGNTRESELMWPATRIRRLSITLQSSQMRIQISIISKHFNSYKSDGSKTGS